MPAHRKITSFHRQAGFTLIELLVVIVILGILAAIVVFAARGAGDKGDPAARATDERAIRTAEEAYCAQAGQYATMDQLIGAAPADTDQKTYKFLGEASRYNQVTVNPTGGRCNGWSYSITGTPAGGVQPGPMGTWSTLSATLTDARRDHTATLLSRDKVWVMGGMGQQAGSNVTLSSVEAYDAGSTPVTVERKAPLAVGRVWHSATLLDDNTKILVVGGVSDTQITDSVEIYDTAADGGKGLSTLRGEDPYPGGPVKEHTATKVHDRDGKEYVLVVGGDENSGQSAARYDVAEGKWQDVPDMMFARWNHTATLLADGRVLVAGGGTIGPDPSPDTAEVYNPHTNEWAPTGPMTVSRVRSAAARLGDGRVVVAGGTTTFDGGGDESLKLKSAEIYDPATDSWTRVTDNMQQQRRSFTATLLNNGKVLVAAGCCIDSSGTLTATTELLTAPVSGSPGGWTSSGSMATARFYHTATLLSNGDVLVIGGAIEFGVPLNSAELYDA